MNAPLSRYLTSFAPTQAPPMIVEPVFVEVEPQPEPALEPVIEVDPHEIALEIALREARDQAERTRAEDVAALEAAHAQALASALDAARAEWAATNAEATGALIDAAFARLREMLSDRLAVVLRPVLADAVLARTLDVLAQTIDRVLADPDRPSLTVRGPRDLIEALRARASRLDGTTFEIAEGVDVTVTADGMHIETRLAHVLAALRDPGSPPSVDAPGGASALASLTLESLDPDV